LHNLFHFLRLRLDIHAQYEIQIYAEAMAQMVKTIVPLAYEAFEDYTLNSISFSGLENGVLKTMLVNSIPSDEELKIAGLSTGEIREFKEKIIKLNNF
jgi:thymidylate synthase (FAD)